MSSFPESTSYEDLEEINESLVTEASEEIPVNKDQEKTGKWHIGHLLPFGIAACGLLGLRKEIYVLRWYNKKLEESNGGKS